MKISISDLIKIANEDKDELSYNRITTSNDVFRFVLAMDIREGKHKVRTTFIYKAYKSWSLKPYPKISFFTYFSSIFRNNRISDDKRYYELNYTAVRLLNKIDNLKIRIK